MAHRNPKPLWGFGIAGWCLLVFAATLAGLMIFGVDIRHWVLARITWNLGINVTMWFVSYFLTSHGVYDFLFLSLGSPISSWIPTMRFSVLTMCIVLIALQVHPRPTGVVRITALFLLGVVVPGLSFSAMGWFQRSFTPSGRVPFDPLPAVYATTIYSFGSALVSALVLAWITRSWWIGVLVGLALGFGAWVLVEGSRSVPGAAMEPLILLIRGDEPWLRWIGFAWNPFILAGLLVWAIRARLRTFPDHCCSSCGYDLRGSPEGKCPECGAEGRVLPGNQTASASAEDAEKHEILSTS